ncbi:MAG: hypothetical protein JWM34_3012 [Ilumatobacteraceae bacterium]|nr:hypothetical protein [Ilumatobacteraceae bacterium]
METLAPPDVGDPWAPRPLEPGQLSPGWRLVFIAGWIGVLAGFAALWQAGRLAGIAPWWLGPETNLEPIYVIALPFIAPLIAIVVGFLGSKWSSLVGIGCSLITAAFALGDLHFPGLAVVDALIGVCGLLISLASLGGRMRAAPVAEPVATPDVALPNTALPDADEPAAI